MKIKDSFALSVNSIINRKLRAWLTLLGIVIGVAAVVSIVSIGEGATASVSESLSDFGADIITISAGGTRAGGFMGDMRGPPDMGGGGKTSSSSETPKLGKLDKAVIKGNSNVSAVNGVVSGRGELVFVAESLKNANITGVDPISWTEMYPYKLEAGRLLSGSDSYSVVIGYRIANDSFEQPITLGRHITIEDNPFTVVGILKEGESDSSIFMNYKTAWTITDVNVNTFSSIEAKVSDADRIEETTEEIEAALMISRKVTEKDIDFSVSSALTMQERINETIGTLSLFLGAIAAVSLLVGAVGIANSMFTSVLEKTKEIGIMKALGSTDIEIMQLFMIESGLFGFVGGFIGVILGAIVSSLMPLFGISLSMGRGMGGLTLVTPELVISAIVISTAIGIVSGLLPARSASKLRPIEALRYE